MSKRIYPGMKRLIERIIRKLHRKPPIYVIIYDVLDQYGDATTEEYYGYFSSPQEARLIWASFSEGQANLGNVMLCRVTEKWST